MYVHVQVLSYLFLCGVRNLLYRERERVKDPLKLKHPQSSFPKKFKMYVHTFVHQYPWLVATYISEIVVCTSYVVLVDTSCCKDGVSNGYRSSLKTRE